MRPLPESVGHGTACERSSRGGGGFQTTLAVPFFIGQTGDLAANQKGSHSFIWFLNEVSWSKPTAAMSVSRILFADLAKNMQQMFIDFCRSCICLFVSPLSI